MPNILSYFNQVLSIVFGSDFALYSPGTVIYFFEQIISNNSCPDLYSLILRLMSQPSLIFSIFVWTWFAILIFKLLLVYPYRWLRSVIKKCRGC